MALNFVKFQRGSQEAYNRLKANNRIEDDALYFIYDKQAPENGGSLYLGEILIGGSGNGISGATKLEDLIDVNINDNNNNIEGAILQYNNLSKTWTPISIKTAIEQASPEIISVLSGEKTDLETIEQALGRIDNDPLVGDIVFINGTPYIYNGESWQSLINSTINDRLSDLEDEIANIDSKIANAVANSEHLIYQKIDTLPELPVENENEYKNIIFLIPKQDTADDNKYDEYMFIDHTFEKVGVLGTGNLDDYVTKDSFNTTVENLNTSISAIETQVETLNTNVSNLQTIESNLSSKITTLETQVGTLNTTVSNLQAIQGDFVTKSTFDTTVGNLDDLKTNSGKENTTIIEEIIDLQNQTSWQLIDDEIFI